MLTASLWAYRDYDIVLTHGAPAVETTHLLSFSQSQILEEMFWTTRVVPLISLPFKQCFLLKSQNQ